MALSRRPTLREVSSSAKVSVFTASRALAFHKGVAQETRARVLKVAQELGYVPNRAARNLKGEQSHTLGVLTANNENLFYSKLVKAIERVVQPRGFHCYVVDAVEDGKYETTREDMFVSALLEQRVAGIIVTYIPSATNMQLLSNWRIPLLFVDCDPPRAFAEYPSVLTDSRLGSLQLGQHFANLGYKNWAFVAHTPGWTSREGREAGFRMAAEACGASVDIVEGGNDRTTAYSAVSAYLASKPCKEWPRALYTSNEPLLNGALRALRERQVVIPGDMAVASFDDFEWSELLDPPITVIDQQVEEIGAIAGNNLLAYLDGARPHHSAHQLVRPILRIRKSCGGTPSS